MTVSVTDRTLKFLTEKLSKMKHSMDLDRKAAKISALSSGDLDKYEHLADEDLNYKPSTVEQAKFDYSPLRNFFNKDWKKKTKRKHLWKD